MAKDPLKFQETIINLIKVNFPRALAGGFDESNQCASEIALVLGAILAQTYRLNGNVIGRTVLDTIIKRIVENAAAVNPEAGAAIRHDLSNTKH